MTPEPHNPETIARPYMSADREGCLAVFDSNRPRYFAADERPLFEAFLSAIPGPYLVLEEHGAIVGCGGFAVETQTGLASFCWGMIRHDRHGRGLGKRLALARLEQIRQDPRVRRVRLDTSQHTTGFFERMGFRVTGRTPDGYCPGLDRVDMEQVIADDAGLATGTGETT